MRFPLWLQAGFWGLVAGSALLLGAAAGFLTSIPQRMIAAVMAFGGGVLISALSFDLMDDAYRRGGFDSTAIGFLSGAAIGISNFLFYIYPLSHTEKYPPLALALQVNKTWSDRTVIYFTNSSADLELFKYFNPSTTWRPLKSVESELSEDKLKEIYSDGGTAWLETTAIDQIQSSPEGAAWLSDHTGGGSRYELIDRAYRIRLIQILPHNDMSGLQSADDKLMITHANEDSVK